MDPETPTPPPSPDEQPTPPRRSRARERYERRRQHATPKSSSSLPRQIRVPDDFRVPAIRIPRIGRLGLGLIGAVLFVVAVVVVLGQLRGPAPVELPNAIWLGTEYTYEDHTDEEIEALVKKLRDHQIGTIYAYVTYLQFNGTWRNEDKFDKVTAFAAQFKEAFPEAELLGLIGVPTEDAANPPRLSDVNLQQQVAELSRRVVEEFGYHGVFIDAEPVWDGDQNFLSLLRAVRATVGIDVPISAAIPPDWSPSNSTIPLPPLIEPGTEWEKSYKQSVALLVDHLAVMAYQSSLTSTAEYAQWVAYQVKTYAEAIAELGLDTQTDLFIGIPTFDAEPPGHDPLVENIDSAVQGIELGLQQAGDAARYVKGLAIYADWTTDDAEWADFQSAWVQKQ
ncbi:MAG: hypothetical protein IT319_19560 [Anaerolineae bacterium]|nr:hypothetical protein [Anaerolineae bacterium]